MMIYNNKVKILITGSRNWANINLVRYALSKFTGDVTLVHGDARGADRIAGDIGTELGFNVKKYPANWEKYGKSAGPIRNSEMLEKEHLPGDSIQLVIAFHEDFYNSKGTKNMIRKVHDAKIMHFIVSENSTHEYIDNELSKFFHLLLI